LPRKKKKKIFLFMFFREGKKGGERGPVAFGGKGFKDRIPREKKVTRNREDLKKERQVWEGGERLRREPRRVGGGKACHKFL